MAGKALAAVNFNTAIPNCQKADVACVKACDEKFGKNVKPNYDIKGWNDCFAGDGQKLFGANGVEYQSCKDKYNVCLFNITTAITEDAKAGCKNKPLSQAIACASSATESANKVIQNFKNDSKRYWSYTAPINWDICKGKNPCN